MENRRNFCIIAHIDAGKSTLADRFLELTGTIEPAKMRPQALDTMDLERERGITIKLQPVRMIYTHRVKKYILNLIDTPGHADFAYEVSRSLAAVEGAILLVDATRGIQAQTLSNLYTAQKLGLAIVPVVNKIDLEHAQTDRVADDVAILLGCPPADVWRSSAKTGEGIGALLAAVIERVPPPAQETGSLRALVFDSTYDSYQGVIAFVRIVAGEIRAGQRVTMMAGGKTFLAEQVGTLALGRHSTGRLVAGDIGYVATGLKRVADCRVGDTLTDYGQPAGAALAGYKAPQPMVFASIFDVIGDIANLRSAVEKLAANDAALSVEPITSRAFGAGFRVGFLGVLHLEITQARLEREFGLDLIVTAPTAAFRQTESGWQEPWVRANILTPPHTLGAVMELADRHGGHYVSLAYLGDGQSQAVIVYEFALAEIIVDFYDRLKSLTAGFASMSYTLIDYHPADLVELTIAIAGEVAAAFTQMISRSQAEARARRLVERLKSLVPRQQFEVSLQAMIGGKIIARETVSALRKDVTAKLYGGDVTRKRKLLEKQKRGKKRLKRIGGVDLPTTIFIEALKIARPSRE